MPITCSWRPPVAWQTPAQLGPAGQPLVVYRVPVAAGPAVAAHAARWLSAAELGRAGRYWQAADRQRYLVSRVALRLVLGRHTRQLPAQVQFGTSPTHKPFVVGATGVHFSLSHTRHWVLLALATAEVGVDVEEVRPDFAFADVLGVSFTAPERAAIAQSPQPRQLFYQSWTRKEALVKATGCGIDDGFAALPSLDGTYPLPGPAWQVSSFVVDAHHLGALAYQAELLGGAQPTFFELTPNELQAALLAES